MLMYFFFVDPSCAISLIESEKSEEDNKMIRDSESFFDSVYIQFATNMQIDTHFQPQSFIWLR